MRVLVTSKVRPKTVIVVLQEVVQQYGDVADRLVAAAREPTQSKTGKGRNKREGERERNGLNSELFPAWLSPAAVRLTGRRSHSAAPAGSSPSPR